MPDNAPAQAATIPAPLSPEALNNRCDPKQFTFATTAELPPLDNVIGQDRAVAAVRFGIGIRHDGYNLFAIGPSGTGKHSTVRRFIAERAPQEPTPSDLCYVHNFQEPHKPKALILRPGKGAQFRKDMENLLSLLKIALPATFESEDYRNRRQAIEETLKSRQEKAFDALQNEAKDKGIALIRTPGGLALAPVRDGEVLAPQEFAKLPETEQEKTKADVEVLQEKLETILRQVPQWEAEARDKLKELNRDVTDFSIGHMIQEMRDCYAEMPEVQAWLDEARQDFVEHVEDFLSPDRGSGGGSDAEGPARPPRRRGRPQGPGATTADGSPALRRYQVNLMVDHSGRQGAPVIFEDNPNLQSLLGRIEHVSQYGALVTDHMLIQPGALHRANGGYLIVEARRLLLAPYAWEEFKRSLKSRELRIDVTNQVYSVVAAVSLEPQPIPLDVKIVLLGERMIYYLLAQNDPDFEELFKVTVDFEEDMDRTPESMKLYANLIGEVARTRKLRPLDAGAVARVIEYASRLVSDSTKLTAHMRSVVDILTESDYWAGTLGNEIVTATDVQKAIDTRIYRLDRMRERSQDQIIEQTVLIDTKGEKVGQINGLSVLQLGQFAFGRPTRITARVHVGKGDVVDIEREVALGGPIHSKGVLILSNFLAAHYLPDQPLSLHASLGFEQSYGGVDGDSASSTELYCLMSALSDVPIKQSFAVTGSVNQMGQVQAIGGANEKIEGYFDICKTRGLTGDQGVLIPVSNVKHLMLRKDVVDAVAAGKFRIFPIATIEQGIEILTGVPAGQRRPDGKFPANSINGLIEAKLALFLRKAREATRGDKDRRRLPTRDERRKP
jgi:lon-related putative ATP-dependent protease